MGSAHAVDRELIEALGRGLPGDRLVVDPDVLAAISHDDAEWAPAGKAAAGVRARTEAEVQHVVRTCAGFGVPVVPRGAGTGLSGGANAVTGCVVLDLSRMNQVLEIDPDNLVCVVQPGAVNNDVKAAVAEHGLWYPPDPASAPWSTIGGNVATNAGGLCCLKYGVTRDYVLGLRAVVGGPAGYGEAVRLGRRTTKGVAGLDLVGLFVGSEGTLGVVTEVTLRLRPALAGTPRTIVGAFPTSSRPAGRGPDHPARADPGRPGAAGPGLPGGGGGVEASGPRRGRRGPAAGPGGHARGLGCGRGRRDRRHHDRGRGAVGRAVHRRRRGRGPVRRPAAGLPGARAARPGADRGRLRAPVQVPAMLEQISAIAARYGVAGRHGRARRRREPAPVPDHAAGRRRGSGWRPRPPSRSSWTRPSPWAAP